MKKEYIDFDLTNDNRKYLLERGVRMWSDPDEDIVGRYYNINYLKARSMDELIDVTYDSLEKISDETNFYRIYKFCVEFYPSQLYAKIYTIFNTYWDWEKYHFDDDDEDDEYGEDRLEYSEMEIDKSIEWLNETFDEVVDEIIPDTSKKRRIQILVDSGGPINHLLKMQKELFYEVKKNIGLNQIYKIENEFHLINETLFDDKWSTIRGKLFFIFKNDCDDDYNKAQVEKDFDEIYRMYPD
jgi:hypothetical protein